jgi:hypothetical protein
MKILPSDNSYKTFCDMTTGYRMFRVISEAVNTGVIDLLDDGERTAGELLAATTLQPEAGRRFITLLVNLGLLEECSGKLYLSRFSRSYLSRTSTLSQRHVLAFEPILMENWARLGQVLHEGQGVLIQEQPPDQLERRSPFEGVVEYDQPPAGTGNDHRHRRRGRHLSARVPATESEVGCHSLRPAGRLQEDGCPKPSGRA